MKLTNAQAKAVNKIVMEYYQGTKVLDFKAPTGSGKTFMTAAVISRLIRESKKDLIFVIATLSMANLPKEFERKLQEYKTYVTGDKNFIIHLVPPPSKSKNKKIDAEPRIYAEKNKVILFGKSSFGDKRILSEGGALESFLQEIKNKDLELIYFRDEAHIGGERKLLKNDAETMLQDAAKMVIKMTATPTYKNKQVILTKEEINNPDDNKFLLKTSSNFNVGISELKFEDKEPYDSFDLLRIGLKKFREVKKEYNKKSNINPALLIQINSKKKKDINQNFEKNLKKIIEIVEKEFGFSWVKYMSNDKSSSKNSSSLREDISLTSLTKNDSDYDVIIFKVALATGWDIPRACMLIQLREIDSVTLNEQTLGRIKRNPISNLKKEDFADNYYVYSNYQEKTRDMHKYQLKPKFLDENLLVVNAKKNKIIEAKNQIKLENSIHEWLKKNETIFTILKEYKKHFGRNKKQLCFALQKYSEQIENKNWNVDINSLCVDNSLELATGIKIEMASDNKWIKLNPIFKQYLPKIKNLLKRNNLYLYQLYFLFLTKNKLKNQIQNLYKDNYLSKLKIEYDLKNTHLKPIYSTWLSEIKKTGEKKSLSFESINNIYAYVNSDSTNKCIQVFDGEPERIFMENVLSVLKKEENKKLIKVMAKNPTFGNTVYLEYEKDGEISKCFVDFVFKGKDESLLYIEVKGHHDYDERKTKAILKGFDSYSRELEKRKYKINFGVVVVNTEEYKKLPLKERKNIKFQLHTGSNTIYKEITFQKIFNMFFKKGK